MPGEPVKNAPESESGRPNSAEAYKSPECKGAI